MALSHAAACATALLLGLPTAHADGWDGAVVLASDKVVRGISQSDGDVALLLDMSLHTDTGWALALGLGGPTYPTRGGSSELTLALTRSWQLDADWSLQLGATHYGYLGSARARSYDHGEFSAVLGWRGRGRALLALSPDTSGFSSASGRRSGRALTVELGWHERLAGRLAFDAGVGYSDLGPVLGAGYRYGSVGLGWGTGPLQVYLTRIGSQAASRGLAPAAQAGPRWVASALWHF